MRGLGIFALAEDQRRQSVQTLLNFGVIGSVPRLVVLERLSILKELLTQFNTLRQVDALLLAVLLHQIVVFLDQRNLRLLGLHVGLWVRLGERPVVRVLRFGV